MKKLKKSVVTLLAFCMALSMMAGCNETKKEEGKEETNESTTVASSETEEKDQEVDVEETEDSLEDSLDDSLDDEDVLAWGSIVPPGALPYFEPYPSDVYTDAYNKYMEKIDELHAENPNLKFEFEDAWFSGGDIDIYLFAGEGDSSDRYYMSDGELVKADKSEQTSGDENLVWKPCYSYEEIKKFPILIKYTSYLGDKIYDELPDGDYIIQVYAFNEDGTQAFVTFGEPVIISEEEYKSLKPGDIIIDRPEGYMDLEVLEDYDGTNDMFEDSCYFEQTENGDYLLMDMYDQAIPYLEREGYAVINIDAKCQITDLAYRYFGDESIKDCVGFRSTPCYGYVAGNRELGLKCNDWFVDQVMLYYGGYGIVGWPVTVTNNTVTSMTLNLDVGEG